MTRAARADCELRTALPATLEAIEKFCVEFRQRCQDLRDRAACFATELLVREALTNAVVHGCSADPGKQVRCAMRLNERRLFIAIEDDGDGFDWRAASRNAPAFPDCSGRGIEILRRYATRVRYNDRGNVVTMIKRF